MCFRRTFVNWKNPPNDRAASISHCGASRSSIGQPSRALSRNSNRDFALSRSPAQTRASIVKTPGQPKFPIANRSRNGRHTQKRKALWTRAWVLSNRLNYKKKTGGGGGNRTRVRKPCTVRTTCLASPFGSRLAPAGGRADAQPAASTDPHGQAARPCGEADVNDAAPLSGPSPSAS